MEHSHSQRTTSDVSYKRGTSMKMPNLPTYRVSFSTIGLANKLQREIIFIHSSSQSRSLSLVTYHYLKFMIVNYYDLARPFSHVIAIVM